LSYARDVDADLEQELRELRAEAERGRDVTTRLVGAEQTYRVFLAGCSQARATEIQFPRARWQEFAEAGGSDYPRPLTDVVENVKDGIRVAATFGVAVSGALRSLRGHVDDFESWWDEHGASLRLDPSARLLHTLRSVTLHQGYVGLIRTEGEGGFHDADTAFFRARVFFDGVALKNLPPEREAWQATQHLDLYAQLLRSIIDAAWRDFAPGETPSASSPPLLSRSERVAGTPAGA
jgi:hypothetical protein